MAPSKRSQEIVQMKKCYKFFILYFKVWWTTTILRCFFSLWKRSIWQ